MLVMRPVQAGDLADLFRLANMAGSGMTSLPPNEAALSANIQIAEASFARETSSKDDDFLMVMEDTEAGRVVGTSAVHARTGVRQAFYAYRLMSLTHYSHSLGTETRSGLLHLTNEYTDCSEVGTLFLDPEARGNGHWLSRSRYMLMAQYPNRFAKDVVAEMRGWFDDKGRSPFWDAIGRHFFDMSYDEADRLCGRGSNQFITELMPKYPIYTNLLPERARQVIGKPHDATRRAMDLLEQEGFEFDNLVDIFDGGPIVKARIDRLKSVQAARRGKAVIGTGADNQASAALIANCSLKAFRLVYQPIQVEGNEFHVNASVLAHLDVKEGDDIMMIPGVL